MEDIALTTLAGLLRNGQCVLVLGPEIAADWSESSSGAADPTQATCADALEARLAEELKKKGIDSSMGGSLPAVAQLYEDLKPLGFGPAKLRAQAAEFYASLRLEPSKDHEALASLPFPLIISTCHDGLLTDALTRAKKPPEVRRYHFRGPTERDDEEPRPSVQVPVVYHIFGKSDEAQTLVLSENDLLDFVVAMVRNQPRVPEWLLLKLRDSNVAILFVGFRITHWYQRILVKALIRFVSEGSRKNESVAMALDPQLQTVPDPERTQTILFYQRGNTVEVCDESVSWFVTELQRRITKAGGIVAEASGPRRPKVFVSYTKDDGVLAETVFNALIEFGLDPWLDVNGLRGGDLWEDKIQQELRTVNFVLVLVTPALVKHTDGYVNTEITLALKRAPRFRDGRFVIPFVSNRLAANERVPQLEELHEVPFDENGLGEALAQLAPVLVSTLQERLKSRR